MTGLRGRAGIAGGALMILAGLAGPLAVGTGTAAAATPQVTGTDVSSFTTVTSWPNVKAAGVTFVGVEAAQGQSITNSQYDSQVTGATGQNLYVAPYVFADPGKIASGATQFTDGWKVIDGIPGAPYATGGLMLPIALDMEWDKINFPTEECYGLSTSAMVTWIGEFVKAAQAQAGAVPIIYTSPDWWATCTGNTTAFSADPLWIADYDVSSPAIPPGWPGYTFWQSSQTGTINGIAGTAEADLDQMQGAPGIVTAGSGTAGSVQVRTLNALAGQAVTYSAAGLPSGVSLSPSGVLSWTSATAVGAYPVTVTPSPAGLPAAVSLTLHVHGAITVVSPGTRLNLAGTPVVFGVTTTGPDKSAGFAASLRATGLPTGVSMNPAGTITGWPSSPGTYKVTVSASDALGGTGSVAFTWTINAAGNSGTTGTIRQAGGSGKCLNDPAGATANGTEPNMWTCDGASYQQWTTVQDGTIRVEGKCLDVAGTGSAADTAVRLWTCNSGDGAQQWQAGSDGELVNPRSGKCLYVVVGSAVNGTRPDLHACANDARHHWLRPAASVASGYPGKCLAAAGSAAGSAVELAACANTGTQHWTAQPDGTVRLGTSTSSCLTETGATAGSVLSIGACGAAATKWRLVAAGPIATELAGAAPGLCVTSPSATVAARLVLGACAATPAATWHVG